MAWITPKTDWGASDKILYTDFNRITGNLAYLKTLSEQLYEYEISSFLIHRQEQISLMLVSLMLSKLYWGRLI